jgi:hypothetical protein
VVRSPVLAIGHLCANKLRKCIQENRHASLQRLGFISQAYAASSAIAIPAHLSGAQGQMNTLFRSLYIFFLPRLPRFGPEDVADTADYYNRLARQHEAAINPPGVWIGRTSTQLALRIHPFKTAKKFPQNILHRAA